MWRHREATNLLTRLYLLFVLSAHLLETARALSDKRLCADEHCKDIISLGTGMINYKAGEKGMISFNINSVIRIKSKGAGINPTIWGIEVNGREGYAPSQYIRENKIYVSKKDLKYVVDVEQKNDVPDLSTSESSVEQGIASETATTTKPLNLTPTESTEHVLNKVSNEKINTDKLPMATPVLSEIVDGTTVPITGNNANANETNLEDKKHSASNNTDGKENVVSAVVESEIKTEIKKSGKTEGNNNEEASVIAKQETSQNELNVNEENKENVTAKAKQEVKENSNEFYSENLITNENNINEITGKVNTDIETEVEKQKDNTDVEGPNVATGILVGNSNENLFNSSDYAVNDEKSIKPSDASNVVREITVNQNPFNSDDVAAKESQTDSVQSKAKNEKFPTNEENFHSNAVINDNKEEKLEFNTNSSTIASEQELANNNPNTIENDFNNTKAEMNLADEITETNKLISKNEHYSNQTLSENHTLPLKSFNENAANSTNVAPVEKPESSSEKEIIETNSVPPETNTSSSENDIVAGSDESQKNNEIVKNISELQDVTEKTITEEYVNAIDLNFDGNKINTNEVEDKKIAVDHVIENRKTDESGNKQNLTDESKSSISIENNNSINIHNQQEITNENYEEVPLQQTKEDNMNSVNTESVAYNMEPSKIELLKTESSIEETKQILSHSEYNTDESVLNTMYQTTQEIQSQAEVLENLNPTTSNPIGDVSFNTPLPTYQEEITTIVPPVDNHGQNFKYSQENLGSMDSKDTVEATTSVNILNDQLAKAEDDNNKVPSGVNILEPKENKGLFSTIMETVNNMLNNNKKNQDEFDDNNELGRILFSQGNTKQNKIENLNEETTFPYCKNIEPNGDCPETSENHDHSTTSHYDNTASKLLFGSDLTMETFLTTMASKIIEMSELIAFLGIATAASLFFIFGYYCFCNSSREGALLSKLNQLESSLLASHKENSILKHNLMSTRQKLASIEDNSFGSNDMVVSLKKELEEELLEKAKLQEQITALQKELENAADAGIELNKIVAELLSNQTGDESIISSVEELQKQLNEQQNTIYEINASLAEKSRENSELQLMIAEQSAKYEAELANVQRDNDELEHEKGNLLTRLEEMKTDFDKDITVALEGKNMEIKRLQNDILELNTKWENEHTKLQTSVAKIEALEECLKNIRKDPKVNISEVIDVANVKAQLIEAQKMNKSLKERFEIELDSRKMMEHQLEVVSSEVEKLKQDFNQSEKDKLEAQTRLEVLSNYFKYKETELQKELSLKEAMWLQQQGETTTTVDRVTAMQDEIQSLKSQNDSLRAEIEAQLAAHKAQIGTLENRAHETWLAARQSDRRYEEARAESTALRRKLTALAGGNINETNKSSAGPATLGGELVQAPSPIHMESPGSPMLGRMPPPPPFLPPPFMGPPPPFMGMPPPPPFVPPGEMRPAPLGRIMSPPPQRSGRFSPQHLDYEDYIDYEGNNTWHRYTYSPPPRTYRSLSPTDSRYNYGTERDLMSTYDTETDFSPPPSPRESRRRVGNSSERIIDSNTKTSYGNTKKFNSSSNKGPLSSGSENSFNTHSHNDTKTKKGNSTMGGQSIV